MIINATSLVKATEDQQSSITIASKLRGKKKPLRGRSTICAICRATLEVACHQLAQHPSDVTRFMHKARLLI